MKCSELHPQPCRFAGMCKRASCTFYHPTTSLPPRHALKWMKSQSRWTELWLDLSYVSVWAERVTLNALSRCLFSANKEVWIDTWSFGMCSDVVLLSPLCFVISFFFFEEKCFVIVRSLQIKIFQSLCMYCVLYDWRYISIHYCKTLAQTFS